MYTVLGTNGQNPVNFVTFYDTLRFVNWLDNNQAAGMTETGAYPTEWGHSHAEQFRYHHAEQRRDRVSCQRERVVQGGVLQPEHEYE